VSIVAENGISQARQAQQSRVKSGPDMFRERQAYAQNEARLAGMREAPREEMYRVNSDQIARMGPGDPPINTSATTDNGLNAPRGVGAVGQLIDAWV
jgi:hypothetical protein